MNYFKAWRLVLLLAFVTVVNRAAIAGPPTITNVTLIGSVPELSISADVGTTNQVLTITNLTQTNWTVLANLVVTQSVYQFADTISTSGPQRFYRVADPNWPADSPPFNMAMIPAGDFEMGNDFPNDLNAAQYELPVHTVYVSAFYMDKYEVSYALWTNVYNWGLSNGYSFDNPGAGKATNHPAQMVSWYDAIKWCNARSQMEGLFVSYFTDSNLTQVYKTGDLAPFVNWDAGYRLPTEAEWEKADRGGASGHRFPWTNTDTISHSQANYYADTNTYSYDVSPTQGYNPAFVDGVMPYTSPIGSFAPNGYGLYDTAGNVWEWCWDYAGNYASDTQTDPRGPSTGTTRVGRGGNWNYYALDCRDSYRYGDSPTDTASNIGFRTARPVP
ncbi:MAG TPA: formylglycine-generating enzyme family protein [Verrucomicrobiae bacterium]|jgi:formylglycine-generating enzyme required for sulfatase activity